MKLRKNLRGKLSIKDIVDYFELCVTNLVSDVARVVNLVLEFLASKAGWGPFSNGTVSYLITTVKVFQHK